MHKPPLARRQPLDVTVHGDPRFDDYHWLRQRDDPEVLDHLRQENAHAEAWFQPLAGLQQRLYDEMLSRLQEDDEEVPWRKGGWWYSTRTAKGQAYPVHLRRRARDEPGAPDAGPAEVLLDLNVLAEGKPFLQVGVLDVSPDGRLLAYSLDETGALDFTLQVKDLQTQRLLPWTMPLTDDVAWAQDSRTLFYVTKDEARRPWQVWRHRMDQAEGTPDVLVFEERDERFWVGLASTRDERWLVIGSHSKDTSELRVIDATRPTTRMRVVLPRRRGREASLDHRDGLFYLLVNDTGPNFRLVTVPTHRPDLAQAQELIAHRDDVMLEDVDLFARHLVVTERDSGIQRLTVHHLLTGEVHTIPFDETVYSAEGSVNAEFDTDVFRFEFTSLVTPVSVYDYDMNTRTRVLRKRQPVLGGYDATRYACRQVMATAPDGTAVPVSLVWRPDRRAAGPGPLLLQGYGAYGIPNDVYFSSSRVSLLDRGVVVALAHVRGGGDRGRTWYDAGKLDRKMNTFTDFIACAQHLVDTGWTRPAQLVIEGGSAGGLLMGAAVNLRPELFRAVVAEVPFVDVLNTMLDDTLPLTVGEYLEWGNPNRKADYRVMRAYSPYDNLRAAAYPAMFLRTSLNDSQVPYWEPVKYAARLRTLKTDPHPVLVVINLEAGHGGASGRYDAIRERAQALAFMLAQWGLQEA